MKGCAGGGMAQQASDAVLSGRQGLHGGRLQRSSVFRTAVREAALLRPE
jgi:hypothetical protein